MHGLETATSFFVELDGDTTFVEGDWVDSVAGLDDVPVEIDFIRTPDGHPRLELTKFHDPTATTAGPDAPANRGAIVSLSPARLALRHLPIR